MNQREFNKYLKRDETCYHCGTTETLVPQHRRGRGMGGSKARHTPSNIIVFCSQFNQAIEDNPHLAAMAIEAGWKLTAGQDPLFTPVNQNGKWYLLDDHFGKAEVEHDWGLD